MAVKKKLRVFYGWVKLGKVRKKEGISIIFENDRQNEIRTFQFVNKMQETVYTRIQTEEEMLDASGKNRMYTEYSVLMEDKGVQGSLKTALEINSIADKNHVSKRERNTISEKLKAAYLASHRGYKEPYSSLFSEFDFE